jgi:hypothetical protein
MRVYCIVQSKEVLLAEGNRYKDQFTCFRPSILCGSQSWLVHHTEELI